MTPRRIVLRLRAILRRGRLENDMQAEMREHLDRAAERLEARGMSPAEARTAARREFGNATVIEEDARDARGARWVEALVSDVRFAFRYFARKPLTTATIIAVLALGIGANSALFSVIQAVLLRPAPAVPKDDARVRIYGLEQATRGARWQPRDFTYPELQALASRREAFAAVAGWYAEDVVIDPADSSGARSALGEYVTPNFFSALGVALATGPGLSAGDATAADLSTVISFRLAEDLYETPTAALGKRLFVNEVPVRIVGVAPPRFQGAMPGHGRTMWLPISARAEVARTSQRWLADSARLELVARLAPAVTKEQATAVTRSVAILTQPDSSRRAGAVRAAEVHATRDAPPASELDDGITVFAAVGAIALLILLVVCTNVSSLMVASAVGRRHEIAVRLSMGASRARVLRQLLTEAMLLALAGGSAGLLLYWWITAWLTTRVHLNIEVAPDVTTVLFTMLFALGTGVFFGLSPALHATRSVAGALREVGTGGVRRSRLQSTFVAAQIVFSQPLLVMLGILLAGIVGERDQPPRSASRVVTAWLPPVSRAGAMSQRLAQVDSLMPRIATQPGVIAAVPEAAGFAMRNVWVPAPDAASPRASDAVRVHVVGTAPGYFELLDVPIRLGRDVSLADTVGAEYAIVIHSDLARSLWGDVIPLGKRLASVDWRAGARDSVGMVVVGVIDAVATTTRGELGQKVYTANGKRWRRNAILIRTQGPAPASVPMLRQFFLREAAGLPVGGVEPLEDVYRRSNDLDLKVAAAAGAAGALALLLASLGLYGVVSLAVSQRTREIGIRIAIGARPQRVAAMFFASGVRVSAIALAIGLPLSVLGVQVLLAYGVAIAPVPNLWVLGLGIGAVMLLVASAATWWPARRAASVDPAQTLRVD